MNESLQSINSKLDEKTHTYYFLCALSSLVWFQEHGGGLLSDWQLGHLISGTMV